MRRYVTFALVTLGVALAIHLDWHLARPAHHRLSLEWELHWLAAVPVFLLTALYVHRAWPDHPVRASLACLGGAAFLAQVVEPLEELLVEHATLEWTFGAERLGAFAAFTATGVVTHVVALTLMRRRVAAAG